MQRFYITTPIFYPNANLHMGHAYTTVLCDALARYHKLNGEETYFLTGSDENTEKVVRAAKAAGQGTEEYLNDIVENFKNLFFLLGISYDQFIRTSDEKAHWPGVIELWNRMQRAGDLEKRSYKGLYCVGHEAFITEKDLVKGKCPEHNEAPQILEEENWFFKLSKYTGAVKEKIESGEFKIVPESRRNEILAQLERGLEDVSFSRPAEKLSVGIPVPNDPSQKIYVWADALTNYISALGFGRDDDENFKKFWPADAQVIGKDILRFHAAIWPAMLLSAKLPLPKSLLVHGFITSGGKKMSKSLGNVIDPLELIKEYGAEAVRYYLLRHISPFEDGDVTKESFNDAYNANLVNGLGNLVSRVMKMASQYLAYPVDLSSVKEPHSLHEWMNKFEMNGALAKLWSEMSAIDDLIQKEKPFELVKKDKEQAGFKVIHYVKELFRISESLIPFMPETARKIQELIKENKMPKAPLFPRK
ncbi:MAG: methionine--tRNA ligase [Candidatus Taylorbacteria bacterium]|nr:methionine--tRNA ligase [Candidatus Taylorbacteria bacterium]